MDNNDLTLLDTICLAGAGAACATGAVPVAGCLVSFVIGRCVWRWHRAEVVAAFDGAIITAAKVSQLPNKVRELPSKTKERVTELMTTESARSPTCVTKESAKPDAITAIQETLTYLPHLLIIGHTRSGKTTALHHLVTTRLANQGSVLVIDPDCRVGMYPGCRVVSEIAHVPAAFVTIAELFDKRNKAYKQGGDTFTPAYIIFDEAHETLPYVEGAWEMIERVVRRGGKLGIHIMIATQDHMVGTLGLERRSELLKNLTKVEFCYDKRGRVCDIWNHKDKETYPVPELPQPIKSGGTLTKPLNGSEVHATVQPRANEVHNGSQSDGSDGSPVELTSDERANLVATMEHFKEHGSKVKAIEFCFKCKKGSSATYQRASKLFDMLQAGKINLDDPTPDADRLLRQFGDDDLLNMLLDGWDKKG